MMNDSMKVGNYKIYLNGQELPENRMVNIEEVVFEDEISLAAMFTIKFNIIDFFKGAWQGIDLETFKLGDVVKIVMGFDMLKEMMIGEITALEPTFDHPAFMIIRGYDRLYKLRFGTKRRSFNKIKDSDLAAKMASEVGLTSSVETTQTVFPYLCQNNQTNYDFLLDRAKRLNYEIMVDDKKLIFRKSQENSPPILTLEYEIDLNFFRENLKL
ncbi:MAG TPA: phage late control D family protein [Thiotrichaceae bacterium]|nr:phage late control D family protein [Thiotrichaceae bacterium]